MREKLTVQIKKHPSLILSCVAVGMLAYGGASASYEVGTYGLIHSFSFVYFVGLGLLGLAAVVALWSGKLNRKLVVFQLLAFVSALWLVPTLVGMHPGIEMAYRNLRLVDGMAEFGFSYIARDLYLSYPALHIFFGAIVKLWSVDIESIIPIIPFIMQLLYLVPLFVFLRNSFGAGKERYCWLGLWVFLLGNWIGQEYFSPQAFGFLLFLVILALVTQPSLLKKTGTDPKPYLVIVFVILALTHLLASLATVCLLGAYALVRKHWHLAIITCLCLLVVIGWDATYGANYILKMSSGAKAILVDVSLPEASEPVEGSDEDVRESINETMRARDMVGVRGVIDFDLGYLVHTNVIASLSGAESHRAVVRVRIAYAAVFAILMGCGVLFMLLRRRSRGNIAILAMALALLPLLLLQNAGWELSQRVYMYELPFVVYFGVLLLDANKKWLGILLCTLFVVASVPFFVCHYGNQIVDNWSSYYRDGHQQVYKLQRSSNYFIGEVRDVGWENGEVVFSAFFPKIYNHYFPISKYDDTFYTFIFDKPEFVDNVWRWLEESPDYTSVYRNLEYEIFLSVVEDKQSE